ncbi:DNA repair protein complementing XP-C cells [Rhinoraja longicauda]
MEAEFESYLRRAINRFSRQLRVDIHKTHLLCLLANGMFRSRTCSGPELRAVALSLLPTEIAGVVTGQVDLPYLNKLLTWFVSAFVLDPSLPRGGLEEGLSERLQRGLDRRSAGTAEELVHLFLITVCALPLSPRLVVSLQPIPLKESTKAKTPRGRRSDVNSRETPASTPRAKPGAAAGKAGTGKAGGKREGKREAGEKTEGQEGWRRGRALAAVHRGRGGKVECPEASGESGFEEDERRRNPAFGRVKNQRQRRVASKISYREATDNSDSESDLAEGSGDSSSRSAGGEGSVSRGVSGRSSEMSEDEDFERNPVKEKAKRRSSGRRKPSDGVVGPAGEVPAHATPSDQWVEVYLEVEKRWVAVDCVHNAVDRPELCGQRATKPLRYIVGFDGQGNVRDVTQRYDAAWMTATRKIRVDPAWWDQTLSPYRSAFTQRDMQEDLELHAKMLDQALPTSIAAYKDHPLYVLQRHLLKYETLHPPTAAILGHCRKEPVYSRDCVQVLRSKDTWLKEARVVREGEVPGKMVKSQSNRARQARAANWETRDQGDLGLFGQWQTEVYQPPCARDGKVPRNEFGNVYLFRPCMLPRGCRHVQLPNLNRVARKLDIDCAAAVTGFDFHAGHSHPTTDGYVVCEEHVDILETACEQQEAEMAKREEQKREKRVLGNWKLLVKGLIIRDRLRARYGTQGSGPGDAGYCEEGPSESTPVKDAASSWPLNRQGGERRESLRLKRGEEKHLFPFEKL